MNRQNRNKINYFIKTNLREAVFTSEQLDKQGITPQIVSSYKFRGWLEQIGKGVYVLDGSKIDWSSGLLARWHRNLYWTNLNSMLDIKNG